MNKETEEYISLREEMTQLASAIDGIINILYVFIAAYLAYALNQEDTLYILISHIVMLPAYLLVIGKRMAMCKISAYIIVYYEKDIAGWSSRSINFNTKTGPKFLSILTHLIFPLFWLIVLYFSYLYIEAYGHFQFMKLLNW